jgi:hypothetical protein
MAHHGMKEYCTASYTKHIVDQVGMNRELPPKVYVLFLPSIYLANPNRFTFPSRHYTLVFDFMRTLI